MEGQADKLIYSGAQASCGPGDIRAHTRIPKRGSCCVPVYFLRTTLHLHYKLGGIKPTAQLASYWQMAGVTEQTT